MDIERYLTERVRSLRPAPQAVRMLEAKAKKRMTIRRS